MVVQGILPGYVLAGGVLTLGLVTAFFWLKARHRDRMVASVMLWRAALPLSRRSVLWHRWSRWLHWLCLGAAVAAFAGALLAPVWHYRRVEPVIVVAEPEALASAREIFSACDAGGRALIAASTAPVVLADFQTEPGPTALERCPTNIAVNRLEALALAQHKLAPTSGKVIFCGVQPPAWLPDDAVWVRTDGAVAAPLAPEWQLYRDDVPLQSLRALRGQYIDRLQSATTPPVEVEALPFARGTLVLSHWLWMLGFLGLAIDLYLWTVRKVV